MSGSYADAVDEAVVDHRYAPPQLDANQDVRIAGLREGARLLSRHVLRSCPPSWERDEALKAIDTAFGWAERAVERHEGSH